MRDKDMRLNLNSRKTKIVCTLGPSSSSPERIRELILAGMDVARLNFSHSDRETHRQTIRMLRRISEELGKQVGILQDLGGPKIRIGEIDAAELQLHAGETISLAPKEKANPQAITVNYPYLVEDVSIGDRILMADGLVELEVTDKDETAVICRVVVGGPIQSHKGVNLPLSHLRVPTFTDKDRLDLEVGLEEDVDFVALSFVRHEDDLDPIRQVIQNRRHPPLLIAKLEKPQAIERLEKILERVDGVMVARGDLGVEMPLEKVPMIQKRIIRLARQACKPVITATQMLRSMVDNPRPTRAEAADVANAILDGTDALMLSEETAMGDFPIKAVNVLDRIARATEPSIGNSPLADETEAQPPQMTEAAISRAACMLARDLKAAAIVASTTSGNTARWVARLRPQNSIIALTPILKTQRQLALSWGVIPGLVDSFTDTDQMFALAASWALENNIARKGDLLIITAGVPAGVPGNTNLLRVIELG
jgi:pyruvate kinase